MIGAKSNIGVKLPNLLLIAGNGRNMGKTHFACRIIEHLSSQTQVCGVKISSHFHPFNEADLLFKNEHFILLQEKQISLKDSSLMLQAGAKTVYFIMADQNYLPEAFEHIQNYLPEHAIVCESGGLHEIATPGLFFFVNQTGKKIEKNHHLNFSPILVTNNGKYFDFDIQNINFSNNSFTLKK